MAPTPLSPQDLSVVIPAWNAGAVLATTLARILAPSPPLAPPREVIVVDDGSTDDTAEIARLHRRATGRVVLLSHGTNRGKGAAVRTGMLAARSATTLFMDADSSTDYDQWPRLAAALEGGADVAIGSRDCAEADRVVDQSRWRRFLGRAYRRVVQRDLPISQQDPQCGFKAFRRPAAHAILPRCSARRWAFDTELLVIAATLGLRVAEVGVDWQDHAGSTVRPFRDAPGTLRELARIRRNLQAGSYQ